ncbi:hypothetical protein GQ54DRAFT_335847 [Martensiomyces pterosporus]|nr:hypothetical protein GQ54DRAFT_335847 [Martensiomyces pterosporus]
MDDDRCKLSALCCGHVFHETCIGGWLKHSRGKTCPVCRHAQSGSPLLLFFEEDDSSEALSETGWHIDDLKAENERLVRKVCTLTEGISTAQEENCKLQKEKEELQIKCSAKESELAAEAETTAKLKDQLCEAGSQLRQHEARISELEQDITRKDSDAQQHESRIDVLQADIAEKSSTIDKIAEELMSCKAKIDGDLKEHSDLVRKYNDRGLQVRSLKAQAQLSTQEKTQAIASLEAKLQAARTKLRDIQDQYSDLSTKYSIREFDHANGIAKSQQLFQDMMAAVDQCTQLEHKVAEQNGAIADKERQIKQLRSQVQASVRTLDGASADKEAHSEMRELQKQYSEVQSRYVARYAECKREAAKSQALAAELASSNLLIAQQDQRIRDLERYIYKRIVEMG